MRKPLPTTTTSSTARRLRVHDVEVGQREHAVRFALRRETGRHAEDGRLYAILKEDDRTREEPVGLFPFADVQVGPNCEFGHRITAVAVEYGPADVTATRPYSEDEADYLL